MEEMDDGCLSSVSYAVLVNGSAKGWVKASRGLRQGDPLSPFLFTLVADVLSRMLLRAEERNMLEGFRVGRNRTRVSHLQFADDTIFFSNTREEDLQTLKSLLLAFGHISGLRAGGFWDPVIERISRRLDGWQKAYLSFGGRITLIQSCLTHMPCYFLSLFKLPASVLQKSRGCRGIFYGQGLGKAKGSFSQGNGCGGTLERVQLYGIRFPSKLFGILKFLSSAVLRLVSEHRSHGESADHIFLHCSLTIGLWHRLFQLVRWIGFPPRSILDMMYIKFNGFGSSKRGIALWQAASIALIRIVWWEEMRGFLG
ncbi:putative mitochondrial protein [Vitis vinifera]|uniref:Putative mitochondrial protein n=1 Tax=Vitis vinifera TaxID=29760 RepID=A0A438E220_VITVI|nr:putative mitochondrial protein [Vitis vinifera]